MLNTEFAVAVLEGIEGTLEELIGRVDPGDLRGRLTDLHDETAAVRNLFEASATPCAESDEPATSRGTR